MSQSERMEKAHAVGYLIVGAIFCVIGSILIGSSFINKDPPEGIQTLSDIRRVYGNDARRGGLYSAGIAILSSGLLVFFGFGITSLVTSHAEGGTGSRKDLGLVMAPQNANK